MFDLNYSFYILTMACKIPKRIFQCFKTKDLSHEFQKVVDTWKRNNPEYEYILYDHKDCEFFLSGFFEQRIVDAYRRILPGGFKADLWRYCILYIYGGVYADIDTLCLGKLDTIFSEKANVELLCPIDLGGDHQLFNGFLASVPKSPILLDCIERVVKHVETNTIPEQRMEFSGPGLLGRSVNTYLGKEETTPYRGRNGYQGNLYLLEFESGTEYVKDGNNVLFQNKNGNRMLQMLYHRECHNASTVCWVNSPNVLAT